MGSFRPESQKCRARPQANLPLVDHVLRNLGTVLRTVANFLPAVLDVVERPVTVGHAEDPFVGDPLGGEGRLEHPGRSRHGSTGEDGPVRLGLC